MMWKKIRIDFTETVKCEFCNRKITSGKGVLIENEKGKISFSGPSCAQNKNGYNVNNPNERIIDITKGCELKDDTTIQYAEYKVASRNRDEENFTQQDDSETHNYLDENAVKAYLTLRFEKLSHISAIIKSERLTQIYQQYITSGRLLDEDENYIRTIMYGSRFSFLTYKNLQAVYAAEYWLTSFIEHNTDKNLDFIHSTLAQLRNKLYLTHNQIIGINKWFSHSSRKQIKLKNNAFVSSNLK